MDLRPLLFEKIQLGQYKDPALNPDSKTELCILLEKQGIVKFNEYKNSNCAKLRHPNRQDDSFPIDFANEHTYSGDVKTWISMDNRGLFVKSDQIRMLKVAKSIGYKEAYIVYINRNTFDVVAAELSLILPGKSEFGLLKNRYKSHEPQKGRFLQPKFWTSLGKVPGPSSKI
jgi:hypothetical protein